jgi:hypothetical protein
VILLTSGKHLLQKSVAFYLVEVDFTSELEAISLLMNQAGQC